MKKIYAPWRGDYITNEAHTKNDTITADECIFCKQFDAGNDEKYFILKRFKHTAVMLNLYPYNSGHLLILPLKHHGHLDSLDSVIRNELFEVSSLSTGALKKTLGPSGFNLGMNLGKGSGAGIPSHLHMHIVPRWDGDTNFMPVITDTKVVSFDLVKTFETLEPAFKSIELS